MGQHPLTFRMNEDDINRLDEIASASDRARSWHLQRAVRAYIDDEYAFLEGVRRGIESAERGEFVSHEDVVAGLEQLLADGDE